MIYTLERISIKEEKFVTFVIRNDGTDNTFNFIDNTYSLWPRSGTVHKLFHGINKDTDESLLCSKDYN